MNAGRLLLVTVLLAAKAAILAAQAPEPILVELGLGRLVARTVPAYRIGDTALVPLRNFFDLAEMRVARRADGALETLVQPGNIRLVVDTTSRAVRLGRERRALGPGELLVADGEIYLASHVLGELLDLEWAVSWPDLQLVVLEPGSLPIARRLRREATLRSRLAASAVPDVPTGLRLALERPRLDGVVFDYTLLAPSGEPLEGATYATALGLDLLGGAFAAGLQSQGAGRGPRTDVSWTGIWREDPRFTQLRLGDGFATGPRVRALRGFSLSNSPYVRPAWVGAVPFGGRLGPGWTVEAWRGGRLIGFDSVNALGEFAFDVPVQYGENPVEFVAYGPFGEVREFNRTYRVRPDGLPARRLEYGLAAGQCRNEACQATGNLDLRYGLDTRWTLRAGVDRFWRDTLADLTHPYLGVSGALGNSVTLEADAVGGAVLRGALQFEPSVDLLLSAEVNRFARGTEAPLLTVDGRRSQWTVSGFARPVRRWTGTFVEAGLDRIAARSGDLTSGRFGLSFQTREVRFIPSVRFQADRPASGGGTRLFYGLNTFVLPRAGLGPVLGRMTFRTTLELEDGTGLASTSAFAGLPLTRGLRAEAGASWSRGMRGAGLTFLLAAELPTVRSYTTVSAGGGMPASGTQYVQGSVIYDPARRSVNLAHGPSLERGGVAGRVYLDLNANGRFDTGDRPVPDVRVVVGQTWSLSDSAGVYRVWDLVPFEPALVTVDSTSVRSPLWVPAFATASVEPSPNRYRELDIPLAPGGVIEGRVVRAATGGAAPGGVVLVLTEQATGETRTLTTFSDGTFYAMGVRPGAWELAVDRGCLDVLGARADTVRFTMLPDEAGATVSGLEVVLR
ncbi:MAG TPA: hypothetical protein VNJ71_05510 [Gemmatimonadales bacterium]|jgi:hypothetical protein|nr:hypothetical protein [Gemmatimonadales bacterium]